MDQFFPNEPTPDTVVSVVSAFHPDVDAKYAAGEAIGLGWHPSVSALFGAGKPGLLPAGHPDIDTLLQNPAAHPLPAWHPKLSTLITRRARPNLPVPSTHSNLDAAYRAGTALPAAHPDVAKAFAGLLPAGHPAIGPLLGNPSATPLPAWHPPLDQMVTRINFGNPAAAVSVLAAHPPIDAAYAKGTALPSSHPDIGKLLASALPPSHPDVNAMFANPAAHPLPAWHPAIENYVRRVIGANHTVSVTLSLRLETVVSFDVFKQRKLRKAMADGLSWSTLNVSISDVRIAGTHTKGNLSSAIGIFVDVTINVAKESDAAFVKVQLEGSKFLQILIMSMVAQGETVASADISVDATSIAVHTIEKAAVNVYALHPDIDAAYTRGAAMPASHPKVHPLMTAVLPPSHPDVDGLLANPAAHPLPSWHPRIEDYIQRGGEGALPAEHASLAWDHPKLDAAYRQGIAVPSDHLSSQLLLSAQLPLSHPDIDMLLQNPAAHPLPDGHPILDSFVAYRSRWSPGLVFSIFVWFVFEVFVARRWLRKCCKNRRLRVKREDVHHRQAPVEIEMPTKGGGAGGFQSTETPGALRQRRAWGSSYGRGIDVPAPRNQSIRSAMKLFALHRKEGVAVDMLLPKDRDEAAVRRPKRASVARLDPSGAAALSRGGSVFGLSREDGSVQNFCNPMHAGKRKAPDNNMYTFDEFVAYYGGDEEWHQAAQAQAPPLASDIVTNPLAMVVANKHIGGEEGEYENRHSKLKTLKSHAVHSRVSCIPALSLWQSGDVLFAAAWVAANAAALVCFGIPAAGRGFDVGRSLGSLAAANAMFLVVPATRNSVLTWFLGLPFDHVVLYHRFMGRITIALALAHGAFYVKRWVSARDAGKPYEWIYVTGAAALLCGLVILATTTNWVRRNHFNAFFWAHYSFIGFFAFGYMHIRQARYFLLGGIALYALDKLLRSFTHFVPRRTLLFRNRGDGIAQVRFPKNPFTELAGAHKVGQYMFVNFPELSLTEWHPFSVSSGPREKFVELHIRALGDHTTRVVALAKECVAQGRQPWIRSEGPYGVLDFELCRYGMLMLVGGGVGVTPVIGIIKDLFLSPPKPEPRALRCVVVCWVLQHARDAATFTKVLRACMKRAEENPGTLPSIILKVHCTRAKAEDVEPPLYMGRPKFGSILDDAATQHSVKSTLIFACGPTRMVESLWDMRDKRNTPDSRVDFHHETFEF